MRKILFLDALLILVLAVGFLMIGHNKKSSNSKPSPNSIQSPSQTPGAVFNKKLYPIDKADSIWVIVNKGRQLQSSYIPGDLTEPKVPLNQSKDAENMKLRKPAATALEGLVADAKRDNVELVLLSGYRSYSYQKSVYGGYVTAQGQAAADTFSARPGHSEHQTGLAADVGASSHACDLEICFGSTPEGKWLAAHAVNYGFVIRYPLDKVDITGYQYEPWHLRYVGVDLSRQLKSKNQTLEEFFGLPIYRTYPATSLQLS